MELTDDLASRFAHIALGHVGREYPNKLDHVMENDADAQTPRALHPAFFGSFDWHSCVHSWWLLLTLARKFPEDRVTREIEALANQTFTEENMGAELAYFGRPSARGFERPYGWGWLLYLHLEASRHERHDWADLLEPLARTITARLRDYLALLTYPITVGTHYNTAFALILALEWAENFDPELGDLIARWAAGQFGNRQDYRGWEPGGDEFLSPVLTASALMARAAAPADWVNWFDGLVLANGWLEEECHPVIVSDRSDGKIAHLDGLNLSRAWCLRSIAPLLKDGSEARTLVEGRAATHLEASLPHVAGDYMGEHWLASFALLALLSRT